MNGRAEATRMRWYCVHTKPRAESQALEHLQRQAFECFLPRIRRRILHAGQYRDVVEPLFPRYLFLRANPQQQNLAVVRSTRGALGLVRFSSQPGEVPERLIEALRQDADADGLIEAPAPILHPGEVVAVRDGVFSGLQGIYAQAQGEGRAIVMLQMLGSVQPVQLPQALLYKTESACLV